MLEGRRAFSLVRLRARARSMSCRREATPTHLAKCHRPCRAALSTAHACKPRIWVRSHCAICVCPTLLRQAQPQPCRLASCVCVMLCVWLASGISRERGRISRGAPWRLMTGLSWRSVLGRKFSKFRGFEGELGDFFFKGTAGPSAQRPPP